jgi:hypothetical protein
MEYGKIISVTGLPGLYELLSSKNDGAIVRSLDDKTTKFVSSRIHNFSHLESIEVYTVRDNVNLVDIFKAMESSSEKIPDGKDASALKKYFEKVYPDLDFERVYTSDLKKMAKWLQVLQSNKVEIKLTELPEEEEELVAEQPAETKTSEKKQAGQTKETEDKPTKAAAKKSAVKEKKEEEPAEEKKTKAVKETKEEKEAPKKKAAVKAKKEDKEEKEAPAKKKAAPKKKSTK